MKNILRLFTAAYISMFAINAQADDYYFHVGIGSGFAKISKPDDFDGKKSKIAFPIEFGFGAYLFPQIRSDLVLSNIMFSQKISTRTGLSPTRELKIKLNAVGFMLNGYYDFYFYESMTPYVTLGLGIAEQRVSETLTSETTIDKSKKTKGGLVWQAGAGIDFAASPKSKFGFAYRYRAFNQRFSVTSSLDAKELRFKFKDVHLFMLNYRFEF